MRLAPSILSADFANLAKILPPMESLGLDIIHFDVMDNHFVPNLTFGPKFIKDLRPFSKIFYDVHLMITEPEKSIEAFIKTGADNFTIHVEASSEEKICNCLRLIKDKGKSAGLSIKPKTPSEAILPFINDIDMILIMTVEPGFGGQEIIESCINKIYECRKMVKNAGREILIEADGGIHLDNVTSLGDLGLDIAVMGSAYFKHPDPSEFISIFNERTEKCSVKI